MKSFEQFLEDAPVRTYNDPSVIASPEERRRAGRREIEKDYVDTQDTQAAAAALRKPSVETEKEKKFGMGTGRLVDAGTKESDLNPLSLKPKTILPTLHNLKNRYQEKLSEKERMIPKGVRESLDEITKDREEDDDKIKTERFKYANKVISSMSGKHPLMDVISASNSTVKDQKGFQKRLQSLKEMIDNDDEGDDDENLNSLLKMRVDMKGKADDFFMKMDDEGYNPFDLMDSPEESEELMSDANVEENGITESADFIPKYARQISKALKGLSNAQVGEFLDSLDQSQSRYKNQDFVLSDFRSLFSLDDELGDEDDLGYNGLNSSWSLSGENMESNGLTPLTDEVSGKSLREVAWNEIVSPNQIKRIKEKLQAGEFDDKEVIKLLMTTGNQGQQQRVMSMMNDYIEKSGSSVKDALTPDGLEGFEDHIRKVTALDARKTWRDQIMPDLKDGDILRNTPASGGRGGNVRERIYKQAGFGELLGDDYQYGQKKDGEKKLKPLSEDDVETFDEESSREDVMDSMNSYLPDDENLPFSRYDFDDAVSEYFYDRDDYMRFREDPEGVYQDIYDRVVADAIDNFDVDNFESYIDDEMIEGVEEFDFDEFADFAKDKFNDINQENQIKIMTLIQNDDEESLKKIVKTFIDVFKESNQ